MSISPRRVFFPADLGGWGGGDALYLHSCLHTSRFFSNGVSGTVPLASSAASPRLQETNDARSLASSSAADISGDHCGRRGSFRASAAAASAASRSSGESVGPPAPMPPFSTRVGPMMTASHAFSAEKSRLASEALMFFF